MVIQDSMQASNSTTTGRAALALAITILISAEVRGDTLYESATLGATGVTGGTAIGYDQFLGVRFQIGQAATVTGVGGHLSDIGSGLYGALVRLGGADDFPDAKPVTVEVNDNLRLVAWEGADILAKVTLPAVATSSDVLGALAAPLDLAPGWYALVMAVPNSTVVGAMPGNGNLIGTPSYFSWQGWWDLPLYECGTIQNPLCRTDDWYDGGFGNARFVVQGQPVPEPETWAMLLAGLGLVGVASRCRQA